MSNFKLALGATAAIVGGIALILALTIVSPLIFIWALNVLLPITIPVSLKTWFAAFLVLALVKPATVSLKD